MVNWTKTWQVIFNPLKCYVLKITKKKKTVDFDYNINGQTLETVISNPYLGAERDKQVQKVVAKGNKALGFIRRNVGSCPEVVKNKHTLRLSDLTLSMPAALETNISKNIFNRLRLSNAEQHASSKATTQETLVQ